MRAVRQHKALAYVLSLLVFASAAWMPTSIFAQTLPGSPFQGGGGSGVSLSGTNTWTGAQTFSLVATFTGATLTPVDGGYFFGAIQADAHALKVRSEQTPDTLELALASTSRSVIVIEGLDSTFDFAHPQQTNPTVFIHSTNQSTTQWIGLTHNATQGVISTGLGPVGLAGGSIVASAATITPTGNVFHVSGTTNITAGMTSMAAGTCVTMIFDGILTITDIAAFNIGAAYTTSADDTLTMCSDGTNWYEASRSVN